MARSPGRAGSPSPPQAHGTRAIPCHTRPPVPVARGSAQLRPPSRTAHHQEPMPRVSERSLHTDAAPQSSAERTERLLETTVRTVRSVMLLLVWLVGDGVTRRNRRNKER